MAGLTKHIRTVILIVAEGKNSWRQTKISQIIFIDLTEKESTIILQNSTYRENVRKINILFNDNTIWNNVYLLDFCYYQTEYEKGQLNSLRPKIINIKLKKDCTMMMGPTLKYWQNVNDKDEESFGLADLQDLMNAGRIIYRKEYASNV